MFHIKSLELVHWDYWQRIKNIPLDAKIITIAGQNGSGKTTLLDALRTLFGLDCSMGRTYKHYARHSGQQTAWIRAVVDNKAVGTPAVEPAVPQLRLFQRRRSHAVLPDPEERRRLEAPVPDAPGERARSRK